MVVCGLVLERSTWTHQDRPLEIDIQRGEARITAWDVQRLYAVAKVRQEHEPLGIVVLRIRGLKAVRGNVVVESRQAGGIGMTPSIDLHRRQAQAGQL